jgi:hypothetical protein
MKWDGAAVNGAAMGVVEYPCAHCVIASTIAAVIRAEVGPGALPTLMSTSNSAPAVTRQWTRAEDVVKEVSEARILDGAALAYLIWGRQEGGE